MEAIKQHSSVSAPSKVTTNAKSIRYFVPVDFSQSSYHALQYALMLAKASSGTIELFHITDANKVVESENPVVVQRNLSKLEHDATDKMQSLREIITEAGVAVRSTQSVIGHMKTQLLKKVKSEMPDIIVIGKSKDTIYTKDVLSCLVKHSTCPVLVVPDSAAQETPHTMVLASDMRPVEGKALNSFFEIVQQTSKSLSVLNIRKDDSSNGQTRNPWGEHINSQFDIEVNFVQHYNPHIVDGIFDFINTHRTDLLCAVRRPSGWLKSLFHQSVSLELATSLNVPVLVVPESK